MSKARDIASATPAPSTVSSTELGYLDGVSSAIQTQIDSKIGQATAINPTIVDAKGDIIAATAADTVSRLAVGANDTVLTADSSTATGLKWATAGGASALSQIATGNMSGTSVSLTGLSNYDYLVLNVSGWTCSDGTTSNLLLRINNNTGNNYNFVTGSIAGGTIYRSFSTATAQFTIEATDTNNTNANRNYFFYFRNCKGAGKTDVNWTFTANVSGSASLGNGGGVYLVDEAVSSIQIINGEVNTFNAGTYTIWGN